MYNRLSANGWSPDNYRKRRVGFDAYTSETDIEYPRILVGCQSAER